MTPALVLGAAHPTTLAVIRSLGRKGIRQVAVGTRGSFVSYSRWHRPAQGMQPSFASLSQFLAQHPADRMALIPCTDPWVAAVAGLDSSLTARFPASVAPVETIQILLDKARFAEAAARLGVPHPRTICIGSPDDVATLPDAVFRDGFLKPRNSRAFQERYGMKATRFNTRSEAIAFLLDARRAGLELVLQEYIPGPATRHYRLNGFVDRNGAVCANFAYRWLRRYPRDLAGPGGSHAVSIPLEEISGAVQAVNRLLGALHYRGVFNAQLKYDERDGQFKILEINPRPWPWLGFAAACGVDVVEMAYRDALELPVPPVVEYEAGRHSVDPYLDLIVGWRLFRQGRLSLWTWMRSWAGATQATFCLDDPIPALVSCFSWARSFLGRRLHARSVRRDSAAPQVVIPPEASKPKSSGGVVS